MDNNLEALNNGNEIKTYTNEMAENAFIAKIRKRLTLMGLLSVIILIGIVMIFTIPQVILMMGQISAGQEVNQNIFVALLLTIAAEITTIVIALWAVWGLKDWKNLLMLKNFKRKNVLIGFGIGILLFILLQIISSVIAFFGADIESSDTSTSIASLTGWQGFITLALLTPIIVPFVEELFFRGYVLNFMRNGIGSGKKRLYWAVIVSSFYFAIMHFQGLSSINDVVLLVWVGLIAVINSILVIKYDSLYPAVAVHIGYNGVTSLVMAFATSLV